MAVPPCLAAAALLLLGGAAAQSATTAQPGATWIPVDTHSDVISNLLMSDLSTPSTMLAGYSTIGVIPVTDVAAWLNALATNPSFAGGTVRWTPGVPYKCTSNTLGCVRSVRVTVLEYKYENINASDCKAYAVVAADAILPQMALLTDGTHTIQPSGPVLYEITAAPNSTATSCTYVVQYPPATQALANKLCDAACFNSSCVPCTANQTLSGGDSAAGCTPASGISPALVAAIQGAAQCLAPGPLGRMQCSVASGLNGSACAQMSCFPGDAMVEVPGGGRRRMRELRLGDSVRVVRADGSLAFEPIYFFGHREPHAAGAFVRLSLAERGGGGNSATLRLSPKHFLPVGPAWAAAVQKRAGTVAAGDTVWAEARGALRPHTVMAVTHVTEPGLWAPYTASGLLLVDGVAASAHSDWHLDPLFDAFGRPDLLPAAYQALMWPLRALFRLLGPAGMAALDARLDLTACLLAPAAALKLPLLATAPTVLLVALGRRKLRSC